MNTREPEPPMTALDRVARLSERISATHRVAKVDVISHPLMPQKILSIAVEPRSPFVPVPIAESRFAAAASFETAGPAT